MSDFVIVQIPGRIPHAIPAADLDRFLRDHPSASKVDAASFEAPAPKRRAGRPRKVSV